MDGKTTILECRGTLICYAGRQTHQLFHLLLWDSKRKNKMDRSFEHSKGAESRVEANRQTVQGKVYFLLNLDGSTTLNLQCVNLMMLRTLIYNSCSISSELMAKNGPSSQKNSPKTILTTALKTFSMPPSERAWGTWMSTILKSGNVSATRSTNTIWSTKCCQSTMRRRANAFTSLMNQFLVWPKKFASKS